MNRLDEIREHVPPDCDAATWLKSCEAALHEANEMRCKLHELEQSTQTPSETQWYVDEGTHEVWKIGNRIAFWAQNIPAGTWMPPSNNYLVDRYGVRHVTESEARRLMEQWGYVDRDAEPAEDNAKDGYSSAAELRKELDAERQFRHDYAAIVVAVAKRLQVAPVLSINVLSASCLAKITDMEAQLTVAKSRIQMLENVVASKDTKIATMATDEANCEKQIKDVVEDYPWDDRMENRMSQVGWAASQTIGGLCAAIGDWEQKYKDLEQQLASMTASDSSAFDAAVKIVQEVANKHGIIDVAAMIDIKTGLAYQAVAALCNAGIIGRAETHRDVIEETKLRDILARKDRAISSLHKRFKARGKEICRIHQLSGERSRKRRKEIVALKREIAELRNKNVVLPGDASQKPEVGELSHVVDFLKAVNKAHEGELFAYHAVILPDGKFFVGNGNGNNVAMGSVNRLAEVLREAKDNKEVKTDHLSEDSKATPESKPAEEWPKWELSPYPVERYIRYDSPSAKPVVFDEHGHQIDNAGSELCPYECISNPQLLTIEVPVSASWLTAKPDAIRKAEVVEKAKAFRWWYDNITETIRRYGEPLVLGVCFETNGSIRNGACPESMCQRDGDKLLTPKEAVAILEARGQYPLWGVEEVK